MQNEASPTHQSCSAPKLSSVGEVQILRDDSAEIVGGTRHQLEYLVSDAQGATARHVSDVSRVDAGRTYTVTSSFRICSYLPGKSSASEPATVKAWQLTAYGTKGEIIGDRRYDTVTTVINIQDGPVSRETRTVPVRLDLSEFTGLDTAALVRKMGRIHLGQESLPS